MKFKLFINKYNKIIKMSIDILMTALVLSLMKIVGDGRLYHQIAGIIVVVLFVLHFLMNIKWFNAVSSKLFSGKLKAKAVFMYVLVILLILSVLWMIVTGVLIATIFPFRGNLGNLRLWIAMHSSSAYCSLILMSVHLGMHWKQMIQGFAKGMSKVFKVTFKKNRVRTVVLACISVFIMLLGIKSHIDRAVPQTIVAPITDMNNYSAAHTAWLEEELRRLNAEAQDAGLYESDGKAENSENPKTYLSAEEQPERMSFVEFIAKQVCTKCARLCPLTTPICTLGADTVKEQRAIYDAQYPWNDSFTFAEFMDGLLCTACAKVCPLTAPQCATGTAQAQVYVSQYVKLPSAGKPGTGGTPGTESVLPSKDSIKDKIEREWRQAELERELLGQIGGKEETFFEKTALPFPLDMMSIMSVYIGGVHYILKFIDYKKKSAKQGSGKNRKPAEEPPANEEPSSDIVIGGEANQGAGE